MGISGKKCGWDFEDVLYGSLEGCSKEIDGTTVMQPGFSQEQPKDLPKIFL